MNLKALFSDVPMAQGKVMRLIYNIRPSSNLVRDRVSDELITRNELKRRVTLLEQGIDPYEGGVQ